MDKLELDKLVLHFAQSNKAEGKSPKTISWYSEMLTGYTRFLRDTGGGTLLGEFSIASARDFVIHEQERGMSPYTVQCKARALKAFASWLCNEGYTPDHVLRNLKLPKAPLNLIEPLTDDEVARLVEAQNPLTALGCRNIAILVLLLDTGLRVSELCGLKTEDTHISEGYLKVMGKGSKERIAPFGGLAQKMLWRYSIHFRPEPAMKVDSSFFLSLDGQPLQANAIKLMLKRWGRHSGIPRLHPHLCRHTFATNFLSHSCGDVFRLQQILGHTTLEMVRKYVHFSSTQAMINGKVSSPMDRIGIRALNGNRIDRVLRHAQKSSGVV